LGDGAIQRLAKTAPLRLKVDEGNRFSHARCCYTTRIKARKSRDMTIGVARFLVCRIFCGEPGRLRRPFFEWRAKRTGHFAGKCFMAAT
jgi:hypothetical protein